MSNGYGIALTFSEIDTGKFDQLYTALVAGLPEKFQPLEPLDPHLTLATFDETIDPVPLQGVLERFSHEIPALKIEFSSFGIFATPENVIYLAPVITSSLLEVHKLFHLYLTQNGLFSNQYYRPNRWVPHTTLIKKVCDETATVLLPDLIKHRENDIFHQPLEVNGISLKYYWPESLLAKATLAT